MKQIINLMAVKVRRNQQYPGRKMEISTFSNKNVKPFGALAFLVFCRPHIDEEFISDPVFPLCRLRRTYSP